MLVAGAASRLADDPPLSMLAVYGVTGGIDFVVEAYLLVRRRRHQARVLVTQS